MTGSQRRHRSTAVVPVSIEGLGDEVVAVTPAAAVRWYGTQERGQRHGAVHCFDITDCAAQRAATAMLGRRSIWYRRVDAWRFEVGPLSRGRRLAGYQGVVGEPPEACLGVQECADEATERLAEARLGVQECADAVTERLAAARRNTGRAGR